jgi:Domain of unknown function (DUF4386)
MAKRIQNSIGGGRARSGAAADPDRGLALAAGVLFVITFLTSIPAFLLYGAVLDDPGHVTGPDSHVYAGAALELVLIVANVGTALALFPVLKRRSEALALGYVAARIVESTFIAVGIVSVLAVVAINQGPAGAGIVTTGRALVEVHDLTFLLGPGFVVGIGNGLLLGYLMWTSRLVPRRMAVLGLIGGPLVCASGIAVMFGAIDAGSAAQALATLPEIAWEASLGVYLIARGFRADSPIIAAPGRDGAAAAAAQPATTASGSGEMPAISYAAS